MDIKTINTYNQEAETIAELHSALIPERIYELIADYFIPNASSADIGCGTGRDTAWLGRKGGSIIGIDASKGMLEQAQKNHPNLHFVQDDLPELKKLSQESFNNILCSAVLMHLPMTDVSLACHRLLELLKPNGFLILSFRSTNEDNQRENGKLYQKIDPNKLITLFTSLNCSIELYESTLEKGRHLTWHNLVIKKLPPLAA